MTTDIDFELCHQKRSEKMSYGKIAKLFNTTHQRLRRHYLEWCADHGIEPIHCKRRPFLKPLVPEEMIECTLLTRRRGWVTVRFKKPVKQVTKLEWSN